MAILKESMFMKVSTFGARNGFVMTDEANLTCRLHKRFQKPLNVSRVQGSYLCPGKQTAGIIARVWKKYECATACKLYDIEELVDYYFHRRLAAIIAITVSYLPFVITPNQITLFGLVLGWASAIFLYDGFFHSPFGYTEEFSILMSACLMFAWIVSDCADGQVARLCKRGTRTGRILDGVVDGMVIGPNMAVIGFITSSKLDEHVGPGFGLYFAAASGLSLWLHALVYDKIKNVYMENTLPKSECDGETVESVYKEYIEAQSISWFNLDTILLGIYHQYLLLQRTFTATSSVTTCGKNLIVSRDSSFVADYVSKYYMTARLSSFCGVSAHVTGLYTAYFFSYYWWESLVVVQLYFIIVLNAFCLIVLFSYWKTGMANN